MKGTVIKAISSFYYVFCADRLYECKARGNFRKSEISPVVGDRVEFNTVSEDKGVIEKVLSRKNILKRPLIANIDKLVIVSSYKTPSPDTLMIDRLTAEAFYNGIEPVVVFNKSDMGDFSEFSDVYRTAGIKTFVVSAASGNGIKELKRELADCISAFAGNSGVGKSSIINALFDGASLKTGEVSEKLGRGRHTTRHTELLFFDNCFIADTPGFAAVESASSNDFKEKLVECFPDFKDYADCCRFASCTHTCEPGCSVIEAVQNGFIKKTRHKSYTEIFNELKNVKQWQRKG